MTYLDDLASRIRAAVPPGDLPHDDTHDLFRLYAVLLLAKGEKVNAEDVHNAWVAWMTDRDPTHEALVPSSDLSKSLVAQDKPYVEAIQLVARGLAEPDGAI